MLVSNEFWIPLFGRRLMVVVGVNQSSKKEEKKYGNKKGKTFFKEMKEI